LIFKRSPFAPPLKDSVKEDPKEVISKFVREKFSDVKFGEGEDYGDTAKLNFIADDCLKRANLLRATSGSLLVSAGISENKGDVFHRQFTHDGQNYAKILENRGPILVSVVDTAWTMLTASTETAEEVNDAAKHYDAWIYARCV